MYADVVVLTYQSPEIDSYTYEVPESLEGLIKPGQLVEIPFGKRSPQGIVINVSNCHPGVATTTIGSRDSIASLQNDRIVIKPISRIILPQPILLPYQIKLLKWMATYYHAPMVNCLEAMLPQIPTKLSNYSSSESGVSRRNREVSSRSKFSTSSNNMQRPISQTLVLVPTINRIPETLAKYSRAKNYLLYHNQLKTKDKFEAWLKILSGGPDYIFGSRSAIFSPCPNLTKIIIFDEHDGAYKDERSPYFNTLTVAEKLSEVTGAKIQIFDSSPKITTYFSHPTEVQIPKVTKNQPKVKIISMEEERRAGNKLPLSQSLIAYIRQTYQKAGKILLFLNKKIQSGQIHCNNCRRQSYVTTKPQVCPLCNSQDIWFYSLNIATLANTVKQLAPQASIRLITESHQQPVTTNQLPAIDIATSSIFYAQIFQKYDLTCHIATDSILNVPDFSSSEKAFSQITDLRRLTKDKGTLILQTFKPQNPLIQMATSSDWHAFYKSQLEERKMLSYPPFTMLVKLSIRGKNQEKITKLAQDLVLKLKEESTSRKSDVFVLGPYQPVFTSKIPRYNIILKIKLISYNLSEREKAIARLSDFLSVASREWQITIEPDSLN